MAKRKRKPIINFRIYSVLEFIDLVRHIVQCMTGNGNFTTPNPPLSDLSEKADKLAQAELKAREGTPTDTQDMHDKREELEFLMEKESMYVYIITDGDETKMLSSGFPLTADESAPPMRPLIWLKQGGNAGEVKAGCKAVQGAKGYIWVYFIGETAPDDIKQYTFFDGSTQAQILINELASKVRIWVRVKPILKDRSGEWQKPTDIMTP